MKCKICKNSNTYIGISGICKSCYQKQWNKDNKELNKQKARKYYLANKERILKNTNDYRLANLDKISKTKSIYKKNQRFKNKSKAIKLLGGKCIDCGVKEPIVIFDFHHLRDKELKISEALGKANWNNIEKEISKCVLLCSNCHRIRHSKEDCKETK